MSSCSTAYILRDAEGGVLIANADWQRLSSSTLWLYLIDCIDLVAIQAAEPFCNGKIQPETYKSIHTDD